MSWEGAEYYWAINGEKDQIRTARKLLEKERDNKENAHNNLKEEGLLPHKSSPSQRKSYAFCQTKRSHSQWQKPQKNKSNPWDKNNKQRTCCVLASLTGKRKLIQNDLGLISYLAYRRLSFGWFIDKFLFTVFSRYFLFHKAELIAQHSVKLLRDVVWN